MKIDQVFYNGVIHTMAQEGETVEALAVSNGVIVDAGSDYDIAGIDAVERIDLQGATVIPGLADTHMHLYADCITRLTPSLHACRNHDDIKQILREDMNRIKPGQWITAENLHIEQLEEGCFPNREVLDEVSSDIPICIGTFCHHIHMLNSAALAAAGIDKDFEPKIADQVERFEDGTPTGVIYDLVYPETVDPIVPRPDLAETVEMLDEYLQYASSLGITQLAINQEDGPFGARKYQELRRVHGMKVRLTLNWYPPKSNENGIVTGFGDDTLRLGATKLLTDGSVGGATALLNVPYCDPEGGQGECNYTQEELDALVKDYYDAGWDISVHGIGDKANDMVLTAFERAYDPAVGDARRFYFVHATLVSDSFIERAAKLPCMISIQPAWMVNYANFGEKRLGTERANRLFPIKDMIDGGLIVSGGTDAPVVPLNPFCGIESSVTRQAVGRDDVTLGPDQAISVYQAVEMCTKNASYWCHDEHRKGTLEKGKLADFAVLDRDVFSVDPKMIHETVVMRTVLGGETVFSR